MELYPPPPPRRPIPKCNIEAIYINWTKLYNLKSPLPPPYGFHDKRASTFFLMKSTVLRIQLVIGLDSLLNSASENQDKGRYNSFWTLRLSGIQIDGGLRPLGHSTRKAVSWQVLCQKSVSFKGAVSQERACCYDVEKKLIAIISVLYTVWSRKQNLSLSYSLLSSYKPQLFSKNNL